MNYNKDFNSEEAYYAKLRKVAKTQTGRMGAITPIQDMLSGLFPNIKPTAPAKQKTDKPKQKIPDIYIGKIKLPKHIADLYHKYKDDPDMYPQLMELIRQTTNPTPPPR